MLRIQWKFSINPCISVSWTLGSQLLFSSYICCLQSPFESLKITERDELEANEEGAFIDLEASDDEDVCVD